MTAFDRQPKYENAEGKCEENRLRVCENCYEREVNEDRGCPTPGAGQGKTKQLRRYLKCIGRDDRAGIRRGIHSEFGAGVAHDTNFGVGSESGNAGALKGTPAALTAVWSSLRAVTRNGVRGLLQVDLWNLDIRHFEIKVQIRNLDVQVLAVIPIQHKCIIAE